MTTNEHIFALTKRIPIIENIVRGLPDSTNKEELMSVLDDVLDHVLSLQGDVRVLSDRIAELTKMIYEPVIRGQFDYPKEGDYNAVREYVEARKAQDAVFKEFCKSHTRAELCEHLTNEFGWYVDKKSYGRNVQRH